MLKELREKAGLTQADLADKLGYSSPQFISNIERGIARLPVSKFKTTARMLGISVEQLIDAKVAYTRTLLERQFKIKHHGGKHGGYKGETS